MSYSNTTNNINLPIYNKKDSLNFEDFNTTNQIVDKKLSENKNNIDTHLKSEINSEVGSHNIRYYNNTLSIFNGVEWVNVITMKTITEQEYANLSDEEKNNGTMYGIVLAETPVTEMNFTAEINSDGELCIIYPEGVELYPEFRIEGKNLICQHKEENLPLEIQNKYLIKYS